MKCPSCQHISDTALVKCSECGTVYDRAALEEFQHLSQRLVQVGRLQVQGGRPGQLHHVLDDALDRRQPRLHLPAVIGGAVVFNGELEILHRATPYRATPRTSSAIWMALSAAPFLSWSPTAQKLRPRSLDRSSRMRPT